MDRDIIEHFSVKFKLHKLIVEVLHFNRLTTVSAYLTIDDAVIAKFFKIVKCFPKKFESVLNYYKLDTHDELKIAFDDEIYDNFHHGDLALFKEMREEAEKMKNNVPRLSSPDESVQNNTQQLPVLVQAVIDR